MYFLCALVIWLGAAFIAMSIAKKKGRSGAYWFIATLLIGPIGLGVVFLPPIEGGEGIKKCPQCAELGKTEARVCRYCKYEFPLSDIMRESLKNRYS